MNFKLFKQIHNTLLHAQNDYCIQQQLLQVEACHPRTLKHKLKEKLSEHPLRKRMSLKLRRELRNDIQQEYAEKIRATEERRKEMQQSVELLRKRYPKYASKIFLMPTFPIEQKPFIPWAQIQMRKFDAFIR